MRAPMGEQWRALANLVHNHGEITLAGKAMDLFVEAQGGTALAQYEKASLLERSGALREAYKLMSALPPDLPNPTVNAYGRGTSALFLGDAKEARSQLERAVQLQPQSGAAWLSLAMTANLAKEPTVADRIIAAEHGMGGTPPTQQAPYFYALGKAHAEQGEHDRAFAAFARGAQAFKSVVPYDREADRREAEESVVGFDAERIAQISQRQSEPTRRAIFVTGLPRSGTTLVEQILASHSEVSDGAEISRLPLIATEIRGHSYTALSRYTDAHGVDGLARLWSHLLSERLPASGRIVDKSLNTTRLIGLAASLLPDAPLIWLSRDPHDCAWSCFRTFFPVSKPWSYDLEDIAFHFRLEDELLARWQDILKDRLLVVPYETLVTAPDQWIRQILKHCGLAEEPQVFTPHETKRTVTTASTMQVRRPINREGIGVAEPYRNFLKPFIDAYYG